MRRIYETPTPRRMLALTGVLALGSLSINCGGNDSDNANTASNSNVSSASMSVSNGELGDPNLTGPELRKVIIDASKSQEGDPSVPIEFCAYTPENPQPPYKESKSIGTLQLVFNGLCQNKPSAPSSLYSKPKYNEKYRVGKINNGDILNVKCKKEGEEIFNSVQESSTVWLKVRPKKSKVTAYTALTNLGFSNVNGVRSCDPSSSGR